MMKKDPFERLKEAREEAGFESAARAAAAMGIPTSSYNSHENGTRGFGTEDAIKYGKKFKVNPVWILFGDEGAPKNSSEMRLKGKNSPEANRPKVQEIDMRAGAGGGGVGIVDALMVDPDRGDFMVGDEMVVAEWDIPDSFLRGTLRIEPSSAKIMEIAGDSGYDPLNPGAPGSVFPGDRVVIDMRDRRPSPPGPFAVYDGIGVVVKLVEPIYGSDPPRLRLHSRNPQYSSYEVTLEEAHIIGRIRGRFTAM